MMSLILDFALVTGIGFGMVGVYLLSRTELRADLDKPVEALRTPHWLYPARVVRQAGIMPDDFRWVYWPLRLSFAVTLPLVLLELFPNLPLWVLATSSLLGLFLLDALLRQRRNQRRQILQSSLSFFVDLVSAYLYSGSSMANAFELASEFGFERKHPLAREVQLVAREIKAGESYPLALERLYLRTGVPELQRLAAVINVGRQAGASMIETLARQAEALRDQQDEINRTLISQKSILLLFAMLIVGLPMFAAIVIFPAALKMTEIFKLLKATF